MVVIRVLAGILLAVILAATAHAAQQTQVLTDFEKPEDLKVWDFAKGKGELSTEHVTHGAHSLKVVDGSYLVSWKLPGDWSAFDTLTLDCFVDGKKPVKGILLIGDEDWKKHKMLYWNRHNNGFTLKPGKNTIEIPVHGLFRGEAGSRNGALHYNIKPNQIIRVDFGFKPAEATAIYLDHLRLVKESRPEGIRAFDFGPESQTIFPGFTGVSWNSVHGENGAAAGLKRIGFGSGMARDDTFPTRLYQDFVEMRGQEFIVDVPNGRYGVWVVYDDLGYWGGEQARHSVRAIQAEGKTVYEDNRGVNGVGDYLFAFENVEPMPGDSLWDLYMSKLFAPKRFEADVKDGALNLAFSADAPWSSKVAAVVVYPLGKKAEAEAWVSELEARNRKEFEDRSVFLGPLPQDLKVPESANAKGYWIGYPALSDTIHLTDAPGPGEGRFDRKAAQGQSVSYTFAVRTLKAFPAVSLTASDLKGPGVLAGEQVDIRYVKHGTARGFNSTSYHIVPQTLNRLDGAGLTLKKDTTRQFWITVSVPSDAKPGRYEGTLSLKAGALNESLPLVVDVQPFALDEPDFAMGFYGLGVPRGLSPERAKTARSELLRLLKRYGMNSFTGGPNITFKGLDDAGKPVLDYGDCDAFFADVKAAGYDKPVMSYGGPGMISNLHTRYTIGPKGREWEKKTGKPFTEILKLAWEAVRAHAQANDWPEILIGMSDEPRTMESAQAQLELYQAYKQAVPWLKIGGSYSVHFEDQRALSKVIQEHFKILPWSAMNNHNDLVVEKAKEFKRDLYIYNQGRTRYSFGIYQWAEMQKGVLGRFQWHLLALHGYQFFDLDGREPDTAMINWGRHEVIPTVSLPRCREGADDFRFAVTLSNLAKKKKDHAAAAEAQAWLDAAAKSIPVNRRKRPEGALGDEAFRNGCIERINKLLK